MSNVQPTQRESYHKVVAEGLGEKQRKVYDKLRQGPRSGRALAKALRWPVNTVWPRLNELRAMGLVEHAYDDWDAETKRNVMIWKVTGGGGDDGF